MASDPALFGVSSYSATCNVPVPPAPVAPGRGRASYFSSPSCTLPEGSSVSRIDVASGNCARSLGFPFTAFQINCLGAASTIRFCNENCSNCAITTPFVYDACVQSNQVLTGAAAYSVSCGPLPPPSSPSPTALASGATRSPSPSTTPPGPSDSAPPPPPPGPASGASEVRAAVASLLALGAALAHLA